MAICLRHALFARRVTRGAASIKGSLGALGSAGIRSKSLSAKGSSLSARAVAAPRLALLSSLHAPAVSASCTGKDHQRSASVGILGGIGLAVFSGVFGGVSSFACAGDDGASAYSAADADSSVFTGFAFSPIGRPISDSLLKKNFVARTTEQLPGMRREIQAVELGKSAAMDDTWRIATKSGQGKKGALTTVTNEIGECAAASFHYRATPLVRAAVARRPDGVFSPEVAFVDDLPNNYKAIQGIFGLAADHVIQDLRHLQNRITSTFITVCRANVEANGAIRDVFTKDKDPELRQKIRGGLLDGTLPGRVLGKSQAQRQGMTPAERNAWVAEIEADGRFRKAFKTNIERVMRPVSEIKHRLEQFCIKFEHFKDSEGRRLFTAKTKPAIEEQYNHKVQYLTEPIRMYIDKKTDTRGLPVVQSFRGTNQSETWHNNVVDFVTGESTSAELANLLLHAGTVRYNSNRRRTHEREEDTGHYNRAGCLEVNEHLVRAGRRKRYRAEELLRDNGERFFNDKLTSSSSSSSSSAAASSSSSSSSSASFSSAPAPKKRKTKHEKALENCSGPPTCYALFKEKGSLEPRTTSGRRHHDKRCKWQKGR